MGDCIVLSSDEEGSEESSAAKKPKLATKDVPIKTENFALNDESRDSDKGNSEKENQPELCDPSKMVQEADQSQEVDCTILNEFLEICENSIINSKYETLKTKFSILKKLFQKSHVDTITATSFLNLLSECKEKASISASNAVLSFNEIYQHLKFDLDGQSIDVTKDEKVRLKKLEKTVHLLVRKIKELDEAEVDFDDEEDSSYLQRDRYCARLNKVWAKYCEMLKKNPYSGRITYNKLGFISSNYNEINLAVNRKFKNNSKFPSYYEMEKLVRKCVDDNKLPLNESKIKVESQHCFKSLGELLQQRRKKELYDTLKDFIEDSEDPAKADPSLNEILKNNSKEGKIKIDSLCQLYVQKQEEGKNTENEENEDNSEEKDSEESDTSESD